jgi:hypothetical protein
MSSNQPTVIQPWFQGVQKEGRAIAWLQEERLPNKGEYA